MPDGHDPWSWAIDAILEGSVPHEDISREQHGLWQAWVVNYEVGNGGLNQVHVNLEPESTRLFASEPPLEAFDSLDDAWYEEPLEAIVQAYIEAHADEFFEVD